MVKASGKISQGIVKYSHPWLPEFFNEKFGVEINYASVPRSLAEPTLSTPFFQISKDEFLLNIPNICSFHVSEGKYINIQPAENSSETEIFLFLIDSVYAVLAYQQNLFCFRGTALEKDGKAVIIAGPPGVGKSILAYELMRRNGFKLLSDGQIFSDAENVYSGFKFLTIWEDMVQHYNLNSEELTRVRPGIKKYFFVPENLSSKNTLRLDKIIVLPEKRRKHIAIEYMSGSTKLKYLWEISSWKRMAELLKKKQKYFPALVQLAKETTMLELSLYHKFGNDKEPELLAKTIEKHL